MQAMAQHLSGLAAEKTSFFLMQKWWTKSFPGVTHGGTDFRQVQTERFEQARG
jgi:hypothetical protein